MHKQPRMPIPTKVTSLLKRGISICIQPEGISWSTFCSQTYSNTSKLCTKWDWAQSPPATPSETLRPPPDHVLVGFEAEWAWRKVTHPLLAMEVRVFWSAGSCFQLTSAFRATNPHPHAVSIITRTLASTTCPNFPGPPWRMLPAITAKVATMWIDGH